MEPSNTISRVLVVMISRKGSILTSIWKPDGSKQRIVDQEIKAYILSELAMKIMVKYDLNKKPSKRRPPQSGGLSDFDLTG